ncbi:MAG: hypothetical protein FWD23_04140 [Oscillospiraceae bacterium]|nr:hypothetical protein [Oscillospiraceae bacterium]
MARTGRNKIYIDKKYIEKRNEIITYRLMILFGIAVCAVVFFVYAMNLNWKDINKLENISSAGLAVTGIPLAGAALFFIYRRRQNADESEKVINSKNLLAVAALFFASDFVIFMTRQNWIPFLTAFAITATVLVFIYYLYQKEFFCFSVFAAAGCFLLYFAQSPLLPPYMRMIFRAVLALFAVFTLVFALALMKGKGSLKNKPLALNVRIFEKNSRYFQFLILSVFIAGFAAASFLSLNAYFFHIICALLVYFVIVGIYFTVKIIK